MANRVQDGLCYAFADTQTSCIRSEIMALRLSHLWTVKRNPEVYVGRRPTRSSGTTVSAAS